MDILTKRCSSCKATKEVVMFSKNKCTADGMHTQCKECNALHYRKNKAYISKRRIAYYHKTPEKFREYSNNWYYENKERALASGNEWARRNKDKIRGYAKKARQLYPERKNYHTKIYRTRKQGSMPSWLTEWDLFVMQEYYYKAKRLEALTGIKWHVDHIHPLGGKQLCGLHVPWNLQLLPARLNIAKGNKLWL